MTIANCDLGKTAVSVALAHIFGFGHTQSDDVHVKKPAPVFIRNVKSLLESYDVVIADKYVSLFGPLISKSSSLALEITI